MIEVSDFGFYSSLCVELPTEFRKESVLSETGFDEAYWRTLMDVKEAVNGVLECQQSVLDACKAAQVEVIHELTPVAVARFNELAAANKRVGGVFHSTC